MILNSDRGGRRVLVAPLQDLACSHTSVPRALPWAFLLQPLWGKEFVWYGFLNHGARICEAPEPLALACTSRSGQGDRNTVHGHRSPLRCTRTGTWENKNVRDHGVGSTHSRSKRCRSVLRRESILGIPGRTKKRFSVQRRPNLQVFNMLTFKLSNLQPCPKGHLRGIWQHA